MTLARSTKTKHNLINYNNNKIITNKSINNTLNRDINNNGSSSSKDNINADGTSNDTKFINLPFRQQPSNEEKRNAKLANIRRA